MIGWKEPYILVETRGPEFYRSPLLWSEDMAVASTNDSIGKISAFVISYNREDIIETCLQSVRFADELIVIDKSSLDRTPEIARRYADSFYEVPWSPTVEATRVFAASKCKYDTIVFLDDDEVLSPEAIKVIKEFSVASEANVLNFPLRHYILGRHDPSAYYWPERKVRAFKRGHVEFFDVVHAGIQISGGPVDDIDLSSAACVHNLSYRNAHEWIEKTNRYTSSPDRALSTALSPEQSLGDYAKSRIDSWLEKNKNTDRYLEMVAVLRAIYDIIDVIKSTEGVVNIRPTEDFQSICQILQADLAQFNVEFNSSTDAAPSSEGEKADTIQNDKANNEIRELKNQIRELRQELFMLKSSGVAQDINESGQSKISMASKENERARAMHAQLNRIQALEQEVGALRGGCEERDAEIIQLRQTTFEKTNTIEAFKELLKTLK